MLSAAELTADLIRFDSVSARSNVAVSDYLQEILRQAGFVLERIGYTDRRGIEKVSLVAKKGGGSGGLAYFGHSDVVPADDWSRPTGPFEPQTEHGRLYGRGSCDMKGSLAAMLVAAAQFDVTQLREPIYFTCTADEEVGFFGAAEVVKRSQIYAEMVDGSSRGIIGEPTRLRVVHGHKGSFGFRVTSRGFAAHSSMRQGRNANLAMIPFLAEMKQIHDETEADARWQNPSFDPPTVRWNIGINDHTTALNVTPAQSVCTVYFRSMPHVDGQQLLERAKRTAEQLGLEFELLYASPPLWTDANSPLVSELLELTGQERAETVGYGTDGCMFGAMKSLVVCGPGDIAQAHTVDEWIALDELERGANFYTELIRRWCCR